MVANDRTKQALPTGVQGKIIQIVENGVDFSVWRSDSTASKEPNKQVHFVFLGRLADWKGVDLLLEAFATVATQTDAVLEIIGDGEMRGRGTRSSNGSFGTRQQSCIQWLAISGAVRSQNETS